MRTVPSFAVPSTVIERRFVPAEVFDADLGRTPCDDSCVVVMGQDDRAELNDWLDAKEHPPTEIEFEEMFGASAVQRDAHDNPSPQSAARGSVSLETWPEGLLIRLVALAEIAADEKLANLAAGELLKRFRQAAA